MPSPGYTDLDIWDHSFDPDKKPTRNLIAGSDLVYDPAKATQNTKVSRRCKVENKQHI